MRTIGVFSNRLPVGGIPFAVVFATALIYLPPRQSIFGTAALALTRLAFLAPFPVLVWGRRRDLPGPATSSHSRTHQLRSRRRHDHRASTHMAGRAPDQATDRRSPYIPGQATLPSRDVTGVQ
ncbi:hypothetical protein [Actinoplanes xinjiangensis]|uniref:hypothetical protein n=1 Tax=Actinoplanes xinjiangensis TaxID=512350 RepID=UPI003436BD95